MRSVRLDLRLPPPLFALSSRVDWRLCMRDRTETQTVVREDPTTNALPGLLMVLENDAACWQAFPILKASRLGRDDDVEVPMQDPKVSREHARVEQSAGTLLLTDLESRNGTFVNGERVSQQRTLLRYDVLRLGRSLFIALPDVRRHVNPPLAQAGLVGGPSLDPVRDAIDRVAASDIPVLITGETGTGKELVARGLHEASGRRGELHGLNCAALPPELVESELFGHARGSFSGSEKTREGLFRVATGGTLLLDEIADLPLEAQAKLLRVLETSEVRAVGSDRPLRVDVRVLAATHFDLAERVRGGTFRLDLFHRLAAAMVRLPPLRERREDLCLLTEHFLAGQARLSHAAAERLLLREWSGNVRELKNATLAGMQSAKNRGSSLIEPRDIPDDPMGAQAPPPPPSEEASLRDALARHRGNVSKVAKELGISRQRLYDSLRRLELEPADFRRWRR